MAGFTALDAMKLLDDSKLTDKEIEMLVSLREGALAKDVDDNPDMEALVAMGLVQTIPLTHPRSVLAIPAYIPSEPGVTVLNELAKREAARKPVQNDAAKAVANVDTKKAVKELKTKATKKKD